MDSEVEFVVALSAKHNHQTVLLALGSVRPTEDMMAVGRLASAQEALHSDSLTIFSMILPSNSLVSIACLHPFDCRLSVQEPSVAVVEHSDINIFVADFELEVVEIPVIDNLDLASEYADEFVALLPLVVLQDSRYRYGEPRTRLQSRIANAPPSPPIWTIWLGRNRFASSRY
jgi:hypothetical protein